MSRSPRACALAALVLAAAVAACGSRAPAEAPPIEYTAREFVVPLPVRVVYARLHGKMNGCPSVGSLWAPPDVVGRLARDRRSARIAMVRTRRAVEEALWGANLAAEGGGTKVQTFAARGRGLGNVEWLMRAWAEGRDPERQQDGFDFIVC